MKICDQFIDGKCTNSRAVKSLGYGETPSDGVHAQCPHNTAKGQWPTINQSAWTPTTPIEPIPRTEWPLWAKTVAMFTAPEDKGIGDTIARTIGPANSEAFKTWYERIFGGTCGCEQRQAEWNAKYRYTDIAELC